MKGSIIHELIINQHDGECKVNYPISWPNNSGQQIIVIYPDGLPSGNDCYIAIEYDPVEIVDFPMKNMVIFQSYVSLPEDKPRFSYDFPTFLWLFLWFSDGHVWVILVGSCYSWRSPLARRRTFPWVAPPLATPS